MKQIDFLEIGGLRVGHAHDVEAATGCTVILAEGPNLDLTPRYPKNRLRWVKKRKGRSNHSSNGLVRVVSARVFRLLDHFRELLAALCSDSSLNLRLESNEA
jgi:hypothetical protein